MANSNVQRIAVRRILIQAGLKYCPYCNGFSPLAAFYPFRKGYSSYCKKHFGMVNRKNVLDKRAKAAVENIVAVEEPVVCGCLKKNGFCNNSCVWIDEHTILLNPAITTPILNEICVPASNQGAMIIPSKMNFK